MALISREIVYLLSLITAWTSNSNADNRILSKLCTFELPPNWLMQAWKSNKIGPDQSVHANLRSSSPGRSGGGAGKGRRACNYVYGIWTSASKKSMRNADNSNDVIIPGTCFSMFVNIHALFRFALIGGNLTAQSTGSHRGIGVGVQIAET